MSGGELSQADVKALVSEITSGKIGKCSLNSAKYAAFVVRSALQDVQLPSWYSDRGVDSEDQTITAPDFEDAFLVLSDVSDVISAKAQERYRSIKPMQIKLHEHICRTWSSLAPGFAAT